MPNSGLEELVQGTTDRLPTKLADSFQIAQKITLNWQDQEAKKLLQALWVCKNNILSSP